MKPRGGRSACLANVTLATFTGNLPSAAGSLSGPVTMSELLRVCLVLKNSPRVVSIPYTFELLWNTLHIWDIHTAQRLLLFIRPTATLGINSGANETLGITVVPKITSQATNLNLIRRTLAYGGSSTVNSESNLFFISVLCLCILYHNFIAYFSVMSRPQSLVSGVYIAVVILTWTTQWLKLACSTGPNRVRVSLLTWGRKQIQVPKRCVL
jgi:hypothetical protein